MLWPLLFILVIVLLLVVWFWAFPIQRIRQAPVAPGEYAMSPAFEWPETNKTVAFSPGPGMGLDRVTFSDPAPAKVRCVMETTCGSM